VEQQIATLLRQIGRDILLPGFGVSTITRKTDGSLITPADVAAQQEIMNYLQYATPDVSVLGEEMFASDQQVILTSHHEYWILDALDGTSNYSAGTPYFSISLARVSGGKMVYGWVYDPVRDELFFAKHGGGAWLNDQSLRVTSNARAMTDSIAIVDLKRLPSPLAYEIATNPPFQSQRNFGSVALDWCWLGVGRGQLYLHGKQNLWDYAAGELVFSEAGGYSNRNPDNIPSLTPRSAIGATTSKLFKDWNQWINNYTTEEPLPYAL
jgi:myo-inositol-1(or 4)-monophosphatase